MASPQKENGYVALANEIVEHLATLRLSGEAMQVLWVIFRKTYGFNKKEDYIALSQFVQFTGLKKPTVCKALSKLHSMGIITKKDNGEGKTYGFIKDFEQWKPLPKKITLPKKIMSVTKKDNNRYPKRVLQKTITKDTLTKDTTLRVGDEVNHLIGLFKELNPSIERLFARPPQREACRRLLKLHGVEKLKGAIGFIVKRRGDRFCPTITTPIQLEDKWGALESYALKLKADLTKNQITSV